MTLASQLQTDIDTVFLNTDDFAISVVRLIGGRQSQRQPMTGIFTQSDPEHDTQRGKGTMRRAELLLNDATCISTDDAFLIDQQRYEVQRVSDPQDGATTVYLIRYDGEAKGARAAGDF